MILASQYYRPPFPQRHRWAADLADMRAAGLDAVYLWATWAWTEPEPGRYAFDDYDELVELAGREGLGVIITTSAELAPYWLHREVPDSALVDHTGRQVESSTLSYTHHGVLPGGCTDHPEVRDRMGAFLTAMGDRYAGIEHLLAWDCWNEIRWNVQTDGYVCFCPHTLAGFRDWLRETYGDLAALNAAWHRRYACWDDVLPGKQPQRSWTETIAYCDYLSWRTADLLSFRADRVRAGDPTHPVIAHSVILSSFMTAGENPYEQALSRGVDAELASRLDGYGVSMFPAWFQITAAETGARLEAARGAAGDKPFWVCELQGGSAKKGIDVMPPVPAATQQRWIWTSYGRGAKAVSFWCWRDEVFGRESAGFGVVGDDGHADDRVAALTHATSVLHAHERLLDAYRPEPAAIVVVSEPWNHLLDWAGSGAEARQSGGSVSGYLTALERAQLPYDALSASHLPPLDRYRLICLPWPMIVRPAVGEALAEWVEAGGTLLVESELDAFERTGIFRYATERPFANRLGLRGLGRRPVTGATVPFSYAGESFDLPVTSWLEPLTAPSAKVMADSVHGPVALRVPLGEGQVVAVGTHLGLAYAGQRSTSFERFLHTVAGSVGALPALRCSEPDGETVQWRHGWSGAHCLLFATNTGEATTLTFTATDGATFGAATHATDLLTDDDHPIAGTTLTVAFAAGGTVLLRWTP